MEHNPKKSKAFIITFIVVFLLLILCYFLFANKEKIFGTKGSMSLGNIFSSLTGTSKQKPLNTIGQQNGGTGNTTGGTNTGGTSNNGTGGNSANTGTGINFNPNIGNIGVGSTGTGSLNPNIGNIGVGSNGAGSFNPSTGFSPNIGTINVGSGNSFLTLKCLDKNASNYGSGLPCSYPISIPNLSLCQNKSATNYQKSFPCAYTISTTYQCSDGKDNDGDGLVDASDPSCHYGDGVSNSSLVNTSAENSGPGSGGLNLMSYDPKLNSESKAKNLTTYQCSDGKDNDGDGLVDASDPECHSGIIDSGSLSNIEYGAGNSAAGLNIMSYDPKINNESKPKNIISQCNDKVDNDGDGLVDASDPNCHYDNDETNPESYDAQISSENSVKIPTTPQANICPYDPLENYYTEEEKANLVLLRRKYYLLAPTIKSQDDVDLVKNDTNQNNALISQSEGLIKDCKAQKDPNSDGGKSRASAGATPNYTGPTITYGNPYMVPQMQSFGTYFPNSSEEFQTFENMMYTW